MKIGKLICTIAILGSTNMMSISYGAARQPGGTAAGGNEKAQQIGAKELFRYCWEWIPNVERAEALLIGPCYRDEQAHNQRSLATCAATDEMLRVQHYGACRATLGTHLLNGVVGKSCGERNNPMTKQELASLTLGTQGMSCGGGLSPKR